MAKIRLAVALLCFSLGWAGSASAQVAYDTATNGAATSGSSDTWAHTVTGANPALAVVCMNNSSETTTGVTYAGVAMTNAGNAFDSGEGHRLTLFTLLAPATGANNVIASFSAAVGQKRCTALSGTGVGTFGTAVFDLYSSVDTGHSHNTVSVTNGLVIDFMTIAGSTTTFAVAAGQTQRQSWNSTRLALISTKAGAATTNTGETWDIAFSHWDHATISMNPVATVASPLLLLFSGQ